MYAYVIRYLSRVWFKDLNFNTGASSVGSFAEALSLPDFKQIMVQEITQGGAQMRLGLQSPKGDLTVRVLGESIDLEYSPRRGEKPMSFEDFLRLSSAILSSACTHIDKSAWRIAAIQEGLLPRLTRTKLQDTAARLLSPPTTFNADLFEWDFRACRRIQRDFSELQNETTNTIVSIKRASFSVNGESLESLHLTTDVNTSDLNKEERLSPVNVSGFFASSSSWHSELATEIMRHAGLDVQ